MKRRLIVLLAGLAYIMPAVAQQTPFRPLCRKARSDLRQHKRRNHQNLIARHVEHIH